MRRLREAAPGLGREEFDRAMLDLERRGRVTLHYHDAPGHLSPADRALLVHDPNAHDSRMGRNWGPGIPNGTYFVGAALRPRGR